MSDNTHRPTGQEMADSLIRFDEIAIARNFGANVVDLNNHNKTEFMRALVFVQLRRDGHRDDDALDVASNMPLGEVKNYFPEPPAEPVPDQPVSAEGKDD